MVRNRDADGIKSNLIIIEVKNRPCLFDSNDPAYGDRAEKARCWEEVCDSVVPRWSVLSPTEKFTAGKEVQKRWRSIRDSYTKMYRQGKCVPAEQCAPGSRRYHYQRDLAFLRQALQNKKPRISQDKYESYSELSSSPQHPALEDIPRIKAEIMDKPLDLKTKPDPVRELERRTEPKPEVTRETHQKPRVEQRPERVDKGNQTIDSSKSLEIKIDANSMSILPEDHFDDDKLFMNSLIPCFKKMSDDTRLLCRIEVLKIIRYALQGNTCFEALRTNEDTYFRDRMNGLKEEVVEKKTDSVSTLSMTTRSADGSRPIRKRKIRSPSPLPIPVKKRGPGRPRKIRPPPSDSEEEQSTRKKAPKLKVPPAEIVETPEADDGYRNLTSVDQLSPRMFMQMYNLARSTPVATPQVPVKTEPSETKPLPV